MSQQDRLNDELLVLRCQEGDAEAFELLVNRWQQRLWRHAWRLTGDESAAWDAVQEAWIGVSRGIARLADAAAFRGWIYQIVSFKCRDSIRSKRKLRETLEKYSEWIKGQHEDIAIPDEPHSTLKESLDQLPGPDRAVLSLRYEENFDTAEIAGILDVPEGTVKSRLFYARKRLRKYLEHDYE